jgi:hypothetical protein
VQITTESIGYYYAHIYLDSVDSFIDLFTGDYYAPEFATGSFGGTQKQRQADAAYSKALTDSVRERMHDALSGLNGMNARSRRQNVTLPEDIIPVPHNFTDLPTSPFNKTISAVFPPDYEPATRESTQRAQINGCDSLGWQDSGFCTVINGTIGVWFNWDFTAVVDDFVFFFVNTNTDPAAGEVGLMYYGEVFFTCHWKYDCSIENGSRNMHLWEAIWKTGGVLLVIFFVIGTGFTIFFERDTVIHWLGLVFIVSYSYLVLFVAYNWSPYCAIRFARMDRVFFWPALPTCLGDDIMDIMRWITPANLPWAPGFVQYTGLADGVGGTCTTLRFVVDCHENYFQDGLYVLAYTLERWTPGLMDALRGWGGSSFFWPLSLIAQHDGVQAYLTRFHADSPGSLPITDPIVETCYGFSLLNLAGVIGLLLVEAFLIGLLLYLLLIIVTFLAFLMVALVSVFYSIINFGGRRLRKRRLRMKEEVIEQQRALKSKIE